MLCSLSVACSQSRCPRPPQRPLGLILTTDQENRRGRRGRRASYFVFCDLVDEDGDEIVRYAQCQIMPSDNPDYYPEDWSGSILVPSDSAIALKSEYKLHAPNGGLIEIGILRVQQFPRNASLVYFRGCHDSVPPMAATQI